MAVDFYTKWLDVRPGPRPPDYYTLLGVEVFCRDLDAIEHATRRRLTRLDDFALHPNRETRDAVQNMMNEVARARVDLVNPGRRLDYDRRLADRLGTTLPADPGPAGEAETPPAGQRQAPRPVEPELPPETAGESPAKSRRAARKARAATKRFERIVWRHLRKWKLNAHEHRLLLAEAAALGVRPDDARSIIESKDHQAEIRAEKKHRRQIAMVIGLAVGVLAAVILGIVLFISNSQKARSLDERNFLASIAVARKCLGQGDLGGADRALSRAREIAPDDPRLKEVAVDAALMRKEMTVAVTDILLRARLLRARGELAQAATELAKARAINPDDPRLEPFARKLAEMREQKFQQIVSGVSASLAAGDRAAATKGLSEAEALLPGDARLAPLRRKFSAKPPDVVTLEGHTDFVNSVAFSPDGRRIASCSADMTVKIWDVATGKEIATCKGHTMYIGSVAFSPDGRRIASGSKDKTVKIWDAANAREITTLTGHKGFVRSVAFSPDAHRIASGGRDTIVRIWDAESGGEIMVLKGHRTVVNSVAFSPDGRRLASGSKDKTVRIWNAESGKEIMAIEGHTGSVRSVAFSPDGRRIVSCGQDETVRIWDVENRRQTATLDGHKDSVLSVAFSPDGSRVASGGQDAAVKIWDVASGREIKTLEGHTGWVTSVAFSPDGRRLVSASGDETVKIWYTGEP
jgi:hypothetical protein